MHYTVMISENQRAIIETSLREQSTLQLLKEVLGTAEPLPKFEREERELLTDMFAALPEEDKRKPGAVHGFTF